tara:strand:- start:10580 stop:10732 length:153 start_codon:yes stop_codon:yes gene_type:complete
MYLIIIILSLAGALLSAIFSISKSASDSFNEYEVTEDALEEYYRTDFRNY